jgi:Tol biopolymer transport system component
MGTLLALVATVLAGIMCWPANAAQPAAQLWTPPQISTDQYESSPTFTPDGQEMYFMLADARFGRYRLMMSKCTAGAWSAPKPASFAAPSSVLEADPFVTPNGRQLYFVSSRRNPHSDDFDIWYVDRIGQGWSTPRRLPEPVNSPGSELLPRLDTNGTLYFGSDRAGGHGQSDIYVATRTQGGAWRVANLGPPVSTMANEYEAEISRDGSTLIVVADRGDRSHLYRFVRESNRWIERARIPASQLVFQVGPLLSPSGDRLLFAQAMPMRSGEMFLIDLQQNVDESWPPCSGKPRSQKNQTGR